MWESDSLKAFQFGLSSLVGLSTNRGTLLKKPVPAALGVLPDMKSVQAALGSEVDGVGKPFQIEQVVISRIPPSCMHVFKAALCYLNEDQTHKYYYG